MRILFVTARFPSPTKRGDQVVPFFRLKHLGCEHEIFLVSFVDRDISQDEIDLVRPFCKEVVLIKHNRFLAFLFAIVFFFINRPMQCGYFYSPVMEARLKSILDSYRFDLVNVYMLRMCTYLPVIQRVPVVLDLIDSMVLNLCRRVATERWLKRLVLREELRRVKHFERIAASQAQRTIVVAEADKAAFDSPNIRVVPLGVNTTFFRPNGGSVSCQNRVVFTGNLFYSPNIFAITWFVRNCWHIVKARIPNVELVIAGSSPAPEVVDLQKADKSISVLSNVRSMADVINSASVAVAPMQSGSGMQFKILEAMSCCVPVVVTPLGLGSIRAAHQRDLWIAESSVAFADGVCRLLEDRTLANLLGQNGRAVILNDYSWEHHCKAVASLYREVLG